MFVEDAVGHVKELTVAAVQDVPVSYGLLGHHRLGMRLR
jgi:hypothetical protein